MSHHRAVRAPASPYATHHGHAQEVRAKEAFHSVPQDAQSEHEEEGHATEAEGHPDRPSADFGPDPDSDTARAVEHVLDVYTGQRVRDARTVDPLFAREVAERVRLFALRGGKRMRARFAWWGWRAGGGSPTGKDAESALRLGAALELIQTCALIHDDVMDGSSLRRGSPALHVEFADNHVRSGMRGDHNAHGRAAAILAGDLALAWADDLVADILTGSANREDVQRLWRAMRGEMVAGQYLDMRAQADGSSTTDRALRIACLKTALYTVERPLALGAALAGADGRTTSALCSAGRSAGIAFQLYDDLLSVFGDSSVTGKPSGEDIRAGKLTYLTAVARTLSEEAGDAAARHVLNRSLGDSSLSGAGLDELRRTLEHTGARRATEVEIDRLVSDSQEHLLRAALSAPVHGRLSALIGSVVGTPLAYLAPDSDVVGQRPSSTCRETTKAPSPGKGTR